MTILFAPAVVSLFLALAFQAGPVLFCRKS